MSLTPMGSAETYKLCAIICLYGLKYVNYISTQKYTIITVYVCFKSTFLFSIICDKFCYSTVVFISVIK